MEPVIIAIAPYWVGVIHTILVEFLGLVLLAIWTQYRKRENGGEERKP